MPDDDEWAAFLLAQGPGRVEQQFIDSLKHADAVTLWRYSYRLCTKALRNDDIEAVRQSLRAIGVAQCIDFYDARDTMISLAPLWVLARQLGTDPAEVFAAVANDLPEGQVSKLFRTFGARKDITLRAFGWQIITTEKGPLFGPIPY